MTDCGSAVTGELGGRLRPNPVVSAGDPRSRKQPFVKRDLSRFSVSDMPFWERASGNRFWESRCTGQPLQRALGRLSRYGFVFGIQSVMDGAIAGTRGCSIYTISSLRS